MAFTLIPLSLLICAVVTAPYVISRCVKLHRVEPNLPPGPKGYPIIGNLLDFPAAYHWLFFSRLRKQYGDIVSLKIFGQRMIIFSKHDDAFEVTVKRHDLYADRPQFVTWDESGWSRDTPLLNGPMWKDHRRFMARLFGTRQLVQKYYGIQLKETRKFLRNLLRSPNDLEHHIHHASGSIILKIVYGHDAKDGRDEFIDKVDLALAQFASVIQPGSSIVDFMPWLRYIPEWMPGGGWKKTMRYYRETMDEVMTVPYEIVKARLNSGDAVPCYVTDLLEEEGDDLTPEKEYSIRISAGAVYSGSALHTFFLAMMIHPE
ncbi:cytochrome P450, partial [Cristinia sonorae]